MEGMDSSPPTDPGNLEKGPNSSAPLQGSTTPQFMTQVGCNVYHTWAQLEATPAPASQVGDAPEPGFKELTLGYGTSGRTDPIKLMVCEAISASQRLSSDSNTLAQVGVMIPHLDTYSGEANLKRFEMFVLGPAAMAIDEPVIRLRRGRYFNSSEVHRNQAYRPSP